MSHPTPALLGSALLLLTAASAGAQPTPAGSGLAGTSWQLVRFQGGDDTVLTPRDRTRYTVEFGADGRVSARIDCNRGSGTWTSTGSGQLQFGPMALTRAMCPPGSMHDKIAKDWTFTRSYVIRDGHLFLSLMADGGIYEFEPRGGRTLPAFSVPAASGARYEGDAVRFWEARGEATVWWSGARLTCRPR